jgi:hypothetical protein
MATYISSNENRFYVALEDTYGKTAAITAASRITAVKLDIKHRIETAVRRDKTGSRTYAGSPVGGRRRTDFALNTYLTSWQKPADQSGSCGQPAYGPLFEAACGGAPLMFGGASVTSATSAGRVVFQTPHGLSAGQGVAHGGEIRFVASIVSESEIQLNIPFSATPGSGATLGATVTYTPATKLPSVSIFDYWSPTSAVHRLLQGAAIDELSVLVNGDFHELRFKGLARDVVDSASYASEEPDEAGQVQASSGFPAEPALGDFNYSVVPGHMGQAWLGAPASQFFTVTEATITLSNGLDARSSELGSATPRAIWPGTRTVTAAFELFSQDDESTAGLYQAARQQSPIEVMFQLGETEGQLMGVYLKSVVPETPEFDDSENRLGWSFRASRAQGTTDDEIAIAFA